MVFIACDQAESLFLSSLITFAPFFSLARSKIECCDLLDSTAFLSVKNTVLRSQFIPWLIAGFMSMIERFFIDFMLSQRRGYVASTVQTKFPSHTEKLELGCLEASYKS